MADTQHVTQSVLTKLAAKMRTFSHDPAQSFRANLKNSSRVMMPSRNEVS